MLQTIREYSQGWIAWVIVILICISFGLWGLHSYQEGRGSKIVVATVNGNEIYQNDFKTIYERVRQQEAMGAGENFVLTPVVEEKLKKMAIEQLIDTQVLTEAAKKAGFYVSQPQIESALLQLPAFQVDGKFSQEQFVHVLTQLRYSPEVFFIQLRNEMLINQLQYGVVVSEYILDQEALEIIKLLNQTRDFSYLVIPYKDYMGQVSVTDAEAEKYYQEHQDQFKTPEMVSVDYLELSATDIMKKINFSDADLKKAYQENSRNFQTQPQWKVAHILVAVPANANEEQIKVAKQKAEDLYQQVTKGADFAELAEKNSADVLSAKQGGVIDWFGPGVLGAEFEKATAALKVGDVSEPVKTKYGFDIIKLLDEKKSQPKSFASVKDDIKNMLAKGQVEKEFSEANDKLANLTYENPNTLEPAAKALGLQIQSTPLFSRDGAKENIVAQSQVVSAAFSSNVLTDGNNSDVIELKDNRAIVLRLNKHQPAAIKTFASVKAEIKAILAADAAKTLAAQHAGKLLAEIKAGKSPAQMAAENNLQWKTASKIHHRDPAINQQIVSEAFSISKFVVGKKDAIASVELTSGDIALVNLLAVTEGKFAPGKEDKEREMLKQQLANLFGRVEYGMYVKSKVNAAKIKIEEGNLDL